MASRPQLPDAYHKAVERLTGRDIGARHSALLELDALAVEGSPWCQSVVDAICAYLREPEVEGCPDREVRREALRILASQLRVSPEDPGEAETPAGVRLPKARDLRVDLSGTELGDVDFSGCRFGEASFAETSFSGQSVFDGAHFTGEAQFQCALFASDASFSGVRFDDWAVFGRTRFHGRANFDGARFQEIAWFGRGEESIGEDDDAAWEAVEKRRTLPWGELNEDDPVWPCDVLMDEYQSWEEGGDGARFNGEVSFRDARFEDGAWFWKARFGGGSLFQRAAFSGRVHLDHPSVDLTAARVTGADTDDEQHWPFGWTVSSEHAGDGEHEGEGEGEDERSGRLVPDRAAHAYCRRLADSDPAVRLSGLRALEGLGDAEPGLRQRVADTICEYLRTPLAFDVTARPAALTADQAQELRVRHTAQRILADHTHHSADMRWENISLGLSGATLIDFDLSECHLRYGDFSGAQFRGTTTFEEVLFSEGVDFCIRGTHSGRASFHGDATFTGARFGSETWIMRSLMEQGLRGCVFHSRVTEDFSS
ncbi:pentapeptide repeat-containing protein [Streptomyces sp. NPDC014622]|uniref:pentapeptide repeat-containing protein n=1 Tax=Streptomyces sp. NPDC014622 TaxID=3364874 RepID=UPI003702A64D